MGYESSGRWGYERGEMGVYLLRGRVGRALPAPVTACGAPGGGGGYIE